MLHVSLRNEPGVFRMGEVNQIDTNLGNCNLFHFIFEQIPRGRGFKYEHAQSLCSIYNFEKMKLMKLTIETERQLNIKIVER